MGIKSPLKPHAPNPTRPSINLTVRELASRDVGPARILGASSLINLHCPNHLGLFWPPSRSVGQCAPQPQKEGTRLYFPDFQDQPLVTLSTRMRVIWSYHPSYVDDGAARPLARSLMHSFILQQLSFHLRR